MYRYCMELVVRKDDDHHVERVTKINVTAPNEVTARRMAMDRAYFNQHLVSSFTSVKKGEEIQ